MATNPMPYQGDPGDENDAGYAECEQKITNLDARVTALEQKAGVGDRQPMPMPKQPGGHASPFFGSSK